LRKQKIEIQTAESGEQIFSNAETLKAETLKTEISYQRSTLPKQKLENRNIIER